MKTAVKSEYDIQAEKFLSDSKITFSAVFLFHGPHSEGDKDFRDVYQVLLTRGDKPPLSIQFGQSIADSSQYVVGCAPVNMGRHIHVSKSQFEAALPSHLPNNLVLNRGYTVKRNKVSAPTAYAMLACLTKYDPGTFEDFCSEYGYDTDSRKAEKTYFAVQEEWKKVRSFFTSEELESLREIN